MSRLESRLFPWHEDPEFFVAAVSFTAKETTFSTRLVEKDYFCTVLLEYLTTLGNALVFKGGEAFMIFAKASVNGYNSHHE